MLLVRFSTPYFEIPPYLCPEFPARIRAGTPYIKAFRQFRRRLPVLFNQLFCGIPRHIERIVSCGILLKTKETSLPWN